MLQLSVYTLCVYMPHSKQGTPPFEKEFFELCTLLSHTERRLHSSPWERNLLYPLCFLVLLGLTLLALIMVLANAVCLVFDPTATVQHTNSVVSHTCTSCI